MDKIDEFFILN